MTNHNIPSPLSGPVEDSQRLDALDVLRGFAVLGILVMNIQSFAMIDAAYFNPTAYGDLTGVNYAVWFIKHVFFDQKFMTIFSMLFGAGIVLMSERAEQRCGRSAGLHYRRMAFLLLFGLAHAYLFWHGDILYTYALCGMAAFLLRRLPAPALLAIGVVLLSISSVLFLGSGLSVRYWPEEALSAFNAEMAPLPEQVKELLATYRGGWFELFLHRVPISIGMQTQVFLLWSGWRAGGLMLIGMALYRMGFLTGRSPSWVYLATIAGALLVGLPLVLCGVYWNFSIDWDPPRAFFLGSQFNYWGSIPMSLGWVALVILLWKARIFALTTDALAAVGRMALTNYLMQTILCTFFFYGWGLGWYGHLERWEQVVVVLVVWSAQLIWSPLWLRHFRFGPFEWLWRSLTYGRAQPWRRAGR